MVPTVSSVRFDLWSMFVRRSIMRLFWCSTPVYVCIGSSGGVAIDVTSGAKLGGAAGGGGIDVGWEVMWFRRLLLFLAYAPRVKAHSNVGSFEGTTVPRSSSQVKPAERGIRLSAYPCTPIGSRGKDFNSCTQGPRRCPKACALPRT